MIQKSRRPAALAPLFAGWESPILQACLTGEMGGVFTPEGGEPASALASLGDFSFLAGRPDEALLRFRPPWAKGDYRLLLPQAEGWSRLIQETYGPRAHKITRYATKKDPAAFRRARLRQLAHSLPLGYRLEPIGEALYSQCLQAHWSQDLVAQFQPYPAYARRALGMAVTCEGRLVSAASTYARAGQTIEVEVDTHPDCRRKGLAQAACAALILACLDQGLYPNWDAHTEISLALAQKLGYQLSHPYTAYELILKGDGP